MSRPPSSSQALLHSRLLLGVLLAVLITSSAGWAGETGNCLLYEVTSPTTRAYILGSIHLMPERVYPLDQAIEQAYGEAELLVVELDVGAPDTAMKIMAAMVEQASYPAGRTLRTELDSTLVAELEDALADAGMSLAMLENQQPWVLSLTLLEIETQRLGFRSDAGLDMHFLERARDRLPIVALEDAATQIELLSGLEHDLQVLMLNETLEQLPLTEYMLRMLLDAWQFGDAEALAAMIVYFSSQDPRLEDYNRRLLTDRNHTMTARIAGMLDGDEVPFVIVGAAHVVGDEGIIALLEEHGFETRQVAKLGPPVSVESGARE